MQTQDVLKSVPLDKALPLLCKMASDEGFRHELATRPARVLSRFGIEVSADQLPAEISLPTAAALEEVVERKATTVIKPPAQFWRFWPSRG